MNFFLIWMKRKQIFHYIFYFGLFKKKNERKNERKTEREKKKDRRKDNKSFFLARVKKNYLSNEKGCIIVFLTQTRRFHNSHKKETNSLIMMRHRCKSLLETIKTYLQKNDCVSIGYMYEWTEISVISTNDSYIISKQCMLLYS